MAKEIPVDEVSDKIASEVVSDGKEFVKALADMMLVVRKTDWPTQKEADKAFNEATNRVMDAHLKSVASASTMTFYSWIKALHQVFEEEKK